jgi:hypothetical protein
VSIPKKVKRAGIKYSLIEYQKPLSHFVYTFCIDICVGICYGLGMAIDEKCCANCGNYEDAICSLWYEGDEICIEDIENPNDQCCSEWESGNE